MITSDHGEAFLDNKTNPLGHGHDIEQWATHIPLVIAGTGKMALEPKRLSPVVKISDIGPTLLSLAGLPSTLGQGHDLSTLLTQPVPSHPALLHKDSSFHGATTVLNILRVMTTLLHDDFIRP